MTVELPALPALASSAQRLAELVRGFSADQLRQQAYPTQWNIAQVLSHLGSGAVISAERIDTNVAGTAMSDDFAPSVWDEWNSKEPEAQAADAIVADRILLEKISALTDEQAADFRVSFGPMSVDLAGFVGMRLNEHALHLWDIEVVLNPAATVRAESTPFILDTLPLIARFGGKPTGDAATISVRTTAPSRDFVATLLPESVALTIESVGKADLELPAEAMVRLVYGRLDPDHTPEFIGDGADLDELGRVFQGF